MPGWSIAVLISEVCAVWFIWKLWRSGDYLFFKLTLSILALVPILGPILALWIANFPAPQHPSLRDRRPKQTDVYDRWRHVLEEKNPRRRFEKWRALRARRYDDL